jgi:subtilisin family serine protease
MFHPSDCGAVCARTLRWLLAAVVLTACQDSAVQPSLLSLPDGGIQAYGSGVGTYAQGPQRMIVVLAPHSSPGAVAAQHGVQPDFVYSEVLTGFAGTISEAARTGLLRDNRIVRMVPDREVRIESSHSQPNATWGIDRVDQRPLPLDATYHYHYSGEGVTAYIVDTGIRFDHTEFEGRAVPGFDAINDGRNGSDCHGHGTHVAGTVGGKLYGVAKNVRLVSVRVMNCEGSGSWGGIIAGLDWIARNHAAPAVANMSLGSARYDEGNQAVRNLISAGVQVAVSAGNNDIDACQRSPASTAEALTAGATTSWDTRALFSNWGPCVDLFAPGNSILSASHSSSTGSTTKSGTSMAAPHVAGVAALFLEQFPNLTPEQLHALIVEKTSKDIVTNANSANAHLLHSLTGSGAPAPPAPPPPAAPTGLTTSLVALNRVNLSWTDHSGDEDGFEIQRRTGNGQFAALANVGANTTSYADHSVVAGETYTYRVRAFNAAGTSGFSNEAVVTVSCPTKGKSLNCR